MLFGGLFALGAVRYYARSVAEPMTRDKRLFQHDAAQLLACSMVLLVPAVWYARIGIRGEPNDRARS